MTKTMNYSRRSKLAINVLKSQGKTIPTYYSETLKRKVTIPDA